MAGCHSSCPRGGSKKIWSIFSTLKQCNPVIPSTLNLNVAPALFTPRVKEVKSAWGPGLLGCQKKFSFGRDMHQRANKKHFGWPLSLDVLKFLFYYDQRMKVCLNISGPKDYIPSFAISFILAMSYNQSLTNPFFVLRKGEDLLIWCHNNFP